MALGCSWPPGHRRDGLISEGPFLFWTQRMIPNEAACKQWKQNAWSPNANWRPPSCNQLPDACNHSSKNGNCEQTLKDSQLHVSSGQNYISINTAKRLKEFDQGASLETTERASVLSVRQTQTHPASPWLLTDSGTSLVWSYSQSLDTLPGPASSKPDSYQHLHGSVAWESLSALLTRCLGSPGP